MVPEESLVLSCFPYTITKISLRLSKRSGFIVRVFLFTFIVFYRILLFLIIADTAFGVLAVTQGYELVPGDQQLKMFQFSKKYNKIADMEDVHKTEHKARNDKDELQNENQKNNKQLKSDASPLKITALEKSRSEHDRSPSSRGRTTNNMKL